MFKDDFYKPQRQSQLGIILIFSTTIYKILKGFWAIGLYFFIAKMNEKTLLYAGIGGALLAIFALVYSIFYYLKFKFHIDEKNREFVLEKGVFATDIVTVPFHKIQQVNFKRNILQRIIGVYSVNIDTAGSSEDEVEIKALSKERADVLAEMLMEYSEEDNVVSRPFSDTEVTHDPEAEQAAQVSENTWKFKLGLFALLKLGLTSNYFRGLALLVAFYSTLRTQFSFVGEELENIPFPAITEIFATVAIFAALFLLGIIITVVETFIKYFGLTLERTNTALQVEMGLRNNTRVGIKERRVQLLQEITNPIQKRLDLHKLKVALASSQDELHKKHIEIPGLPHDVVSKVKNYFYSKEIEEQFHIKPHKILLLRKIFRRCFPIIVGAAALQLVDLDFSGWLVGLIVFIYILAVTLYQFFAFKKISLCVSADFLIKHSGLWNKRKQYLEMYKLQSVSVSQPIWYRKRGLVNLVFHSAGGDIYFPLVQKAEITSLINFILYKIESTEKSWM